MTARLNVSAGIAALAALLALPGFAPAAGPAPSVTGAQVVPDTPELPPPLPPPLPPLLPPLPPPPGADPPAAATPPAITLPFTAPATVAVGQPLRFRTAGRDRDAAVNSLAVDFDDGGGFLAESACRLRPPSPAFALDRTSDFSVPYAFTRPGRHTIQVTLGSGDCGAARQSTTQTVQVNVLPGRGGRERVGAAHAQAVAAASCPGADAVPTALTQRAARKATLCVLNHVRARHGLRAFRWSRRLRRAGAIHNRHMARAMVFAHRVPDGPSLGQRLRRVRYRGGAGENLGAGAGAPYATPRGIVSGWMNSSVHRANVLERRYRFAGVAIMPRKPWDPPTPGATYTAELGTSRR